MAAIPQLERISPSSADSLANCPRRWFCERVDHSIDRKANALMVRGSCFHEAISQLMLDWVHGAEIDPEDIGFAVGAACAGRVPVETIDDIRGMVSRTWARIERDHTRSEVLLVEPATPGPNGRPEPCNAWRPVNMVCHDTAFAMWGIPDLVTRQGTDGTVTIHDWKTGYKISKPCGWAPYVYAAMLPANWANFAKGAPEPGWPIRVVWNHTVFGQYRGWQDLWLTEERCQEGIFALQALISQANAWACSGEPWPELENEYCWTCPRLAAECALYEGTAVRDALGAASGAPTDETQRLAAAWFRADQERKAAEGAADTLADTLKAMACAGVVVSYPDGKRLSIDDNTSVSWRIGSQEQLVRLLGICQDRDLDPVSSGILTISGQAMGQLGLKDDPDFAEYRTPDGKASIRITRKKAV